jgi:nucleoside-diphosphate-sugar epimerase
MKTILITGINGYLGSNLAKRYSKKYKIVGLEYDTYDLYRIKDDQFEVFASKDGIPKELFKKYKIDIIIHTATFYGRNNESNSQMSYANMYLPQLLLEKAIQNGCKLFINTDTVLNRFTSSYSLTKKQFKDWLKFYTNNQSIKVINLKLEHFYGPGTSNTNFITMMIQKMLRNENTIPLTSAEQNRDFLYIDDLMKVYDLFLNIQDGFSFFNEYNVGAGVNSNLKEILEFIKVKTNSTSILDFGAIPYRTNELMQSNNDISLLKELGWYVESTIEEGLLKVIEFEKNHKEN